MEGRKAVKRIKIVTTNGNCCSGINLYMIGPRL